MEPTTPRKAVRCSTPERRGTIRRSLRASLLDGVAANVMLGITEQYLVPFAIALKAGNQAVGVLNAVKSLTQALCQLYAPSLTEWFRSRKRLILAGVFWQAACLIPMAAIPFVLPAAWQVPACILLTGLMSVSGALALPAWFSLMADHIPERSRGRYFGWRTQILGFVSLVTVVAAGALLHLARGREAAGFAALFVIASAARFVSRRYLGQMHEPPQPTVKDQAPVSIWRLLDLRERHRFSGFLGFVGVFLFAVYLGSPFITVYLLKELRYSYLTFAVIQLAGQLSALLTIRYWGRQADRFGNIKVIKACCMGVVIMPFLWIAPPSLPYLLAVQVFAGAVWSGFNLAIVNFAFDAAPAAQRTSYIAASNLATGLGIFFGSLAGGWLATHLPPWRGSHVLPLLLISGFLRLAACAFWASRLKEVRRVTPTSTVDMALQPGLRLLSLMLRPFSDRL
jgi:MFS family permease